MAAPQTQPPWPGQGPDKVVQTDVLALEVCELRLQLGAICRAARAVLGSARLATNAQALVLASDLERLAVCCIEAAAFVNPERHATTPGQTPLPLRSRPLVSKLEAVAILAVEKIPLLDPSPAGIAQAENAVLQVAKRAVDGAVNTNCTCGGRPAFDGLACPACNVWHALTNTGK